MAKDRNTPDDMTVCIGQWRFQVSAGMAYVHHADKPGDIHIKADCEGFVVDVWNDEVEDVKATLAVPYDELGGV